MHLTQHESRFVIDPVCEQVVDAAHTAHTRTYRGEPFYFCCSQCRSAFDRTPNRYASPQNRGPHH